MKLLRYIGGSFQQAGGSRCSSCSKGHKAVVRTTQETILVPTEDGGLESMTFYLGHEYYLDDYQADFLLGMNYHSPSGQVLPRFKQIEE